MCILLLQIWIADASPTQTMDVTIRETHRLVGETPLGVLGKVHCIAEIGNEMFLLDGQLGTIQTVNLDIGENKLLIGPGEGPGELSYLHWMVPMGCKLAVCSYMPKRLKILESRHSDIEELSLVPDQKILSMGYMRVPNILVAEQSAGRWMSGKLTRKIRFAAMPLDGVLDGGDVKTAYFFGETMPTAVAEKEATGVLHWREDDFRRMTENPPRWCVGSDRVYVCTEYSAYEISVYNAQGQFLTSISRPDYVSRVRSDEERMWHEKMYPGQDVEISAQDPDIIAIFSRPNGDLWILPSDGCNAADQDKLEFDVFDTDFRLTKRIRIDIDLALDRNLPLSTYRDGLFVLDNAIYVSTELQSNFAAEFDGVPGEPLIIRLELPRDM